MVVDGEQDLLVTAECHDCTASQGGCKNAEAFFMWMHRRSEESVGTHVECHLKK